MNVYFSRCAIVLAFLLASCAVRHPLKKVRQEDLDAWKDVSVEALDTHSLWITIPMKEVKTKNGIVYRYYNNSKTFQRCLSEHSSNTERNSTATASAHGYGNWANASGQSSGSSSSSSRGSATCFDETVGCNNVFKIKNEKVISYEPKGQCYTDESVQPEGDYRKPVKKNVAVKTTIGPDLKTPEKRDKFHCMQDSDCASNEVCATVRGEYPGSYAKSGLGF